MSSASRRVSVLVSLLAALGAHSAFADEAPHSPEEVKPPEKLQEKARQIDDNATPPKGKAGPFMLNLKVGPSFNLNTKEFAFAIAPELGYAVVKGDGTAFFKGDLYLVLSPDVEIGQVVGIIIPAGVQYDAPLPLKGLYIYPRVTAGVGFIANPGKGDSGANFVVTPGVGIKYLFNPSFHIGLEPVSMPIFIGQATAAEYRAYAYAGFNL